MRNTIVLVLSLTALWPSAAYAQGPPLVPTDTTGISPGSPGFSQLQQQVDSLVDRTQFGSTSTNARVIPRTITNRATVPSLSRTVPYEPFVIFRDPLSGLLYVLPR